MTLHALWLELEFIQFYSGLTEELDSILIIQFNSNTLIGIWTKLNQIPVQTIGLWFSWKKMKCKLMKKILKICYAYDFGGAGTPLHASLLENWAKQIQN